MSLSAWVDRRPLLAKLTERFEYAIKRPAFGCQACGNCVLGHMEYVCPQTCPKQMRNGPCGGTFFTRCEVIDQECIWVSVYQRAEAAQRVAELKTYIPAPDRSAAGHELVDQLLPGPRQPPGDDFADTIVDTLSGFRRTRSFRQSKEVTCRERTRIWTKQYKPPEIP